MSHVNCNNKSRKGKHLTYEERIKIEVLYKLKLKPKQIGEQLGGRNRRTIEREIARGLVVLQNSDLTTRTEYSADLGQKEHDSRATNKGPTIKIGKDHKLAQHIENKIRKEKYSPEAVIGEIKVKAMKFDTSICTKTIYNYLDKEIFLGISNKDLWIKKDRKKRKYRKIRPATNNKKGTSISERPIEIEKREQVGHWEIDTVVGKREASSVLLVLTERSTRQELIFKIKSKTQEQVIKVLDRLERRYGSNFSKIFKTITSDNGSEFLDFEGMESSIKKEGKRTKIYYAHPYCSWERGTNENINRMIRRFIPKGADISKYSTKEIERIQHWINNYPRRILGYKSSNDLFKNILVA